MRQFVFSKERKKQLSPAALRLERRALLRGMRLA